MPVGYSRLRRFVGLCALAVGYAGCSGGSSNQTSPPPPSNLQIELVQVATGFTNPLDIQQAGDGSGRLFVVEQAGRIKIIQNGNVLAAPFLDVSSEIVSGGEEGLLGLAFHPNFSTNGCFYVNYTSTKNGNLQTFISEFQAIPPAATTVSLANEHPLFTVDQPETNHNGGGLAFGNDGFLYIGLGDGGGAGDQHGTIGNAQDLTTRLGKMLRISVTCNGAFTVPSDNPFVSNPPGAAKEIWLYGLRNPFRFSFDHPSGNLWIGDVGQDSFEEVDLVTPQQKGSNMGWRCKEGTHPFNMTTPNCQTATFLDPVFDYDHSQGDETVIGGYVYHGTNISALAGNYVFGDFISGRIWSLAQNNQGQFVRTFLVGTAGNDLAGFGQDAALELYVARYSSGVVARLHQVGTP
jgi:glucose/arabinose dehydrogenase